MIDKAFPVGFLKEIDTDDPEVKYQTTVHKLFQDYLNRFNVPYYDKCCPLYAHNQVPVKYDINTEISYFYDVITGEWLPIPPPDFNFNVIAGDHINIDYTDPDNPIIHAIDFVESVIEGTNITIDNTDPFNPIISADFPTIPVFAQDDTNSIDLSGGGVVGNPLIADLIVDTVTNGGNNILSVSANGVYVPPITLVEGDNITIDNSDPLNPVISAESDPFTTLDTITVDLTGDGDVTPLSADVNISLTPNNAIITRPDGLYVPTFLQDGLIWGGIVTWHSDYTYEVTAAGYYIAGVYYESPAHTVAGGNPIVLNPADPTFNRIDVFYVDTTEEVYVLEGTPSSTPDKPDVNNLQIELSFAIVEVGTTEPSIDTDQIYLENTGEPGEWTGVANSVRIVLNGSVAPLQGTFNIEATNSVAGDNVTFVNDVSLDIASMYTLLTFDIKPKLIPSNLNRRRISFTWRLGATVVGVPFILRDGVNGFSAANITTPQVIAITLSDFGLVPGMLVDTLEIETANTNGTTFGYYIDDVELQGQPVPVLPDPYELNLTTTGVSGDPATYDPLTNTLNIPTPSISGTFGWQDTLIVDPDLTQNNFVDMVGHELSFNLGTGLSVGWGGPVGSQYFGAQLYNPDGGFGEIYVDKDYIGLYSRDGLNNINRSIELGQTEMLFQSDVYRIELIYGYTSGPGYVWTDVLGDGVMTLQPPSGGGGSYELNLTTDLDDYESNYDAGTDTLNVPPFYAEITKAELDTHITNSTLVEGATYKITGVHPNLYNDGVSNLTSIIIKAATKNELELQGHGIFYNPLYNQADANTGIWTDTNTYAIGDKTTWGGYRWTNLTGAAGTSASILALDGTNWSKIAYNTTDYDLVSDIINYDYQNNILTLRRDRHSNVVICSQTTLTYFVNVGRTGHPISVFQWGNPTTPSFIGVSDNVIENSYAETINLKGYFFQNNYSGSSQFFNNRVDKSSFYYNNKVENYCSVYSNTIVTGGSMLGDHVRNSSNVYQNTISAAANWSNNRISDNCSVYNNSIAVGLFQRNIIEQNSQCYSNSLSTARNRIIYNTVKDSSFLYNNTLADNGVIWGNAILTGSWIGFNTINGGNATFYSTIYRNTLVNSYIQSNTCSSTHGGITDNFLQGGKANRSGGGGNYSTITGANLTGGGDGNWAQRICHNRLFGADIQNYTSDSVPFEGGTFESITLNWSSINNTQLIKNLKATANSITLPFQITFTGAAGVGAIGAVTIPIFPIPTGFFIEEVLVDVGAGLTEAGGAIINLGIATDGPTSGLNNTTGLVSTLNTNGVSRYQLGTSGFTKATALRTLVMEVTTTAITGGTATFMIRLAKLG